MLTAKKKYFAILTLTLVLFVSLFSVQIQPAQAAALKDLNQCADYAKPSVNRLAQTGVITGDQNGYFNPRQDISRGQMVTLIVKSLGLDQNTTPLHTDSFKDVPKGHWANKYVEIAYQTGITRGVAAGQFGVNQSCTREQMITLFVNSLKLLDSELSTVPSGLVDLSKFTDSAKISAWARDPIAFAVYMGLISGTSATTMAPATAAERQQVAVLTDRFIEKQDSIVNDIRAQRMLGKSMTEQFKDQGISNTGDIQIKLELQDADLGLPAELSFNIHMINEILWPDTVHQYIKIESADLPAELFPTTEMEQYLVDGVMYQNIPDENNNAEWISIPQEEAAGLNDFVQAIKDTQTSQMLLPDEIHKTANVSIDDAEVNETDGYKITYTGQITDMAGILEKLMPTVLLDRTDSSDWTDILNQIRNNVKTVHYSEVFFVGADHKIYDTTYSITIECQDASDALAIPLKSVTISGSTNYKYNNFQINLPPEALAAL